MEQFGIHKFVYTCLCLAFIANYLMQHQHTYVLSQYPTIQQSLRLMSKGKTNMVSIMEINKASVDVLVFHLCIEAASVCLRISTPIYNILMDVLKLIKCSCVSDVPCSSLWCKGKTQKLSCTILCVCHCSINCNIE